MSRLPRRLSNYLKTHSLLLGVAILHLPLVLLIVSRNLRGMTTHPLGVLYATAAIVGYHGLAVLVVALLVSVVLGLWRRSSAILLGLLLGTFLWYLLIDAEVFSLFEFHLDSFWVGFVAKDPGALGLPASQWISVGGAWVAMLLLEYFLWRAARALPHRGRWVAAAFVGVLVATVASQIVHVVAYEKGDERITSLTPRLPLYLPLRSHSHAVRYGDHLPLVEASTDRGAGALTYPRSPLVFGEPGPEKNLLVLLLESWRADAFDGATTPNLWEFGQQASVYRDHFSSGNSTIAGLFGLFYGIHPTYWEAVKASSATLDNPVLIDAMVDRGYRFGVFARSNFARHKIQDTVFRGIRVVEEQEGPTDIERDEDLTRQLIAFLEARAADGQPFFELGFYKASHFDYKYDEEAAVYSPNSRFAFSDTATKQERRRNDYRNALHYDDRLVARVLEALDRTGLSENTVVVITSDHGESFDDEGGNFWGHGSNFTRYQTQVPLILKEPGRAPEVIDGRSSHLDVVPTLMRSLFRCQSPVADYSDGVDLHGELPKVRTLVIASYFDYAFVSGDEAFESRPLGLKIYSLEDASQPLAGVDLAPLRSMASHLTRFASGGVHRETRALRAGP